MAGEHHNCIRMFASFITLVVALFFCIASANNLRSKSGSCVVDVYVLALQDDCGFESIHGTTVMNIQLISLGIFYNILIICILSNIISYMIIF